MYLLKGGTVVNYDGVKRHDVLLLHDKILKIGANLTPNTDVKVIDCSNKYILPGLIDCSVHFREPGYSEDETVRTGSQAAVCGGVTTVLDMPDTVPMTTRSELLRQKLDLFAEFSLVNYACYAMITPENTNNLAELAELAIAFKLFTGGGSEARYCFTDTDDLSALLSKDYFFVVHAEDQDMIDENALAFKSIIDPEIHGVIRGNDVAATAVQKLIEIGAKVNARLQIADVSTKEELLMIRRAKAHGYNNLSAQIGTVNLFFSNDLYSIYDGSLKCNPPVRSKEDIIAIWQDGIGLGVLDVITSNHAPWIKAKKAGDYEEVLAGVPMIQEMITLLLQKTKSDDLSWQDLVKYTAFNPAQTFGLKHKGVVKAGMDADIAIINPDRLIEFTSNNLKSKCGWSLLENKSLNGCVEKTFVNGNLVWDEGEIFEEFRGRRVY